MSEAHLDNPGEITWRGGNGPAAVIGPCLHPCTHPDQRVIAWGPSMRRYELVQCDTATDLEDLCAGRCRAWVDSRGGRMTQWLTVQLAPAAGRR